MQASWIDPEDIQGFLAQLEGPRKAPAQVAWEVHTLPVQPLPVSTAQPLMGEPVMVEPFAAPPPPPSPPIEMPLSDHRPGPVKGEIWNIREQLRSLRERAEESGIVPAATASVDSPQAIDNVEPAAQPLSAEAQSTVEAVPVPLGPQPESPPLSDPATLPPPIQPPPSINPQSIEYSGPAPSTVATTPLFATSSTSSTPATRPLSVEWGLEAVLEPATPPAEQESEAAPTDNFVPPKLGLSDRLNALALWATTRLGTDEVLLVDDYGDVLWGGQQHTALVLAAMMAWHSAQRANAESACVEPERIDKEISPGRSLTVIPVRTRYGMVSLAVIAREKLADDAAQAVRAALVLAVEGD